jgi:hypothetical protein
MVLLVLPVKQPASELDHREYYAGAYERAALRFLEDNHNLEPEGIGQYAGTGVSESRATDGVLYFDVKVTFQGRAVDGSPAALQSLPARLHYVNGLWVLDRPAEMP